ncbi:hypothetical protein Nepgr_007967 [Nepenthes gracilis]|uniref:Uncharacterized protein n=1 Tax=Nepenthes gracilis TaxID=150966 RepID=A0AAD3S7V7_NEPGR|nr:hypothetical protein Nepgr_007967 [Nepenthes gracilis]
MGCREMRVAPLPGSTAPSISIPCLVISAYEAILKPAAWSHSSFYVNLGELKAQRCLTLSPPQLPYCSQAAHGHVTEKAPTGYKADALESKFHDDAILFFFLVTASGVVGSAACEVAELLASGNFILTVVPCGVPLLVESMLVYGVGVMQLPVAPAGGILESCLPVVDAFGCCPAAGGVDFWPYAAGRIGSMMLIFGNPGLSTADECCRRWGGVCDAAAY